MKPHPANLRALPRLKAALCLFLVFGLAAPTAHAIDMDKIIQPDAQASAGAQRRAESHTADPAVPQAMVLLVYGLLLAGGGYALYRYLRRGGPRLTSSAPGGIELCRTRTLGNRQYLVVANVEGRRMLLGVGPGFISHLSDLKQETDVPQPPAKQGQAQHMQLDTIQDLPDLKGGNGGTLPFNALITRINERLGRQGEGTRE